MSKKNSSVGEFRHLLSVIRLASLANREYIAFNKSSFKNIAILRQLTNLGLVENFQQRGGVTIISLKQTYWKSFIFPTHAVTDIESADGRLRKNRSAKNIRKNQFRLGHYALNSLTTDAGILAGHEAVFLKKGGLPLFKAF